MATSASPCRLFVYLAREAPLAAVLRRGPSAWTRLSLWHTDNDTFEHGQWFRARVYERRCDLSADGSLFGYFARKEGARTFAEVGADSWIAVSRPPWFSALALWAIGWTYCAGALFPGRRTLFISGIESGPDQGALRAWLRLTKTAPFIDKTPGWTDRTVYFNRLLRDGWRPVPDERAPLPWWERASPDGRYTLVMMPRTDVDFRAYGGPHVIEYGVQEASTGAVHDLGLATWADWDQRGRLVLARDGRLLRWRPPDVYDEIADFNAQTPEPHPAPEWATRWPARPGGR